MKSSGAPRNAPESAATPSRHSHVSCKSDDITPSPQRVFAPNITDPTIRDEVPNPDLSDPSKTATLQPSDGVFDFGGRRDQGAAKRPQKLMPNLQDITQFFTRKTDPRKPPQLSSTPTDPPATNFSVGSNNASPFMATSTRRLASSGNTNKTTSRTPKTLPTTPAVTNDSNYPNPPTANQDDTADINSTDLDLELDDLPDLDLGIDNMGQNSIVNANTGDSTTPGQERNKALNTVTDPPSLSSLTQSNESDKTSITDPSSNSNQPSNTNNNPQPDPMGPTPIHATNFTTLDSSTVDAPLPFMTTTHGPPKLKRPSSLIPTKSNPPKQKDNDDSDSRPLSNVKLRPARSSKSSFITLTPQQDTTALGKGKKRNVLFSPDEPEVRILGTEPQKTPQPTKDTPTVIIERKHRMVFEISIKIGPNVQLVQNELRSKLLAMLAFIQKWIDPVAAFAPKQQGSKEPYICGKDSYPEVIFILSQTYFYFNSQTWYNKSQASGKMVRLSAVIAMNKDPSLIESAKADLNQLGIIITAKAFQEVDTNSRLIFLGAPNSISKQYAKFVITKILEQTETDLSVEDPDYSLSVPLNNWPDFAIVCMQPQGLPYVAKDRNEKYEPPARERRAIHIMCRADDYERLARLVTVAKGKGLWTQALGMCYPAETPDMSTPDEEISRYVRMVESHQSIEMCYGSIPLTGLLRADDEFRQMKDDDTTALVSVKKIISLIELFDSEQDTFVPAFFCTIQHDDKRFHAYYPGGNPLHKAFVAEWKKCPGPQIYYFLLKRKFLPKDVARFIRKTFSVSQQSLCAKAKYNRRTRLAYVPNSNSTMDIVDAIMSPSSRVDPFMGLSDSRVKAIQADAYKGPELGSPDYFDFDEGQSITTLKNKSEQYASKTTPTLDIDKRSIYEPDGSTIGDTMDVDGDDLGDEDEDAQLVQFDLSAIQNSPPREAAPSSTQPALVPAPINAALQVGTYDDEAEEIAGASFATELETLASDFGQMIVIIDSLLEEVQAIDPVNSQLLREKHSNIPDTLRQTLSSDADGSLEAMEEYLTTIRSAIVQAKAQEQAATQHANNGIFEEDHSLLEQTAMETNDPIAKPQGCTAEQGSPTTRTETAMVSSELTDSTSRLGADPK